MNGPCGIRIDRLVRSVADLTRALDFYVGALGFEAVPESGRQVEHIATLRLGDERIDLEVPTDPLAMPAAATAPDPRFQHAAIVTRDIDRAWRRLVAHGAAAISVGGPQRLPANTGGVAACKFRDPDGHPLELIEFPAGVGDRRWQNAHGGATTLGIDHFALVVESVDDSVAFFAQIGFEVMARGVNRGLEQDRLDGLDGVEVDVVALKPTHGSATPHLELLCYRRPRRPVDVPGPVGSISKRSIACLDEIVCIRRPTPGFDAAADARALQRSDTQRIRDPDGHRFTITA